MDENARFYEGTGRKVQPKLEKLSFFKGNQKQLFAFCLETIQVLLLHILDPNHPFFI